MTPAERSAQIRKNADELPLGSHTRALLHSAANDIDVVAKEFEDALSECRRVIVGCGFVEGDPEVVAIDKALAKAE